LGQPKKLLRESKIIVAFPSFSKFLVLAPGCVTMKGRGFAVLGIQSSNSKTWVQWMSLIIIASKAGSNGRITVDIGYGHPI
jgi:hypothetical protein